MTLLQRLKISCQDTSPLISESLDHPLSLSQRLRLTMHLGMCKACRYYLDQFKTIRNLARKLGQLDTEAGSHTGLRPEFKQKLKESIKSA